MRLLVHCGIDIDAKNKAKNTALHTLASNRFEYPSAEIIDYLINNTQIHLDLANDIGDSPLECARTSKYAKQKIIQQLQEKMKVPSLKCRCARLAKYRRLPYERCLPSTLANFVVKH